MNSEDRIIELTTCVAVLNQRVNNLLDREQERIEREKERDKERALREADRDKTLKDLVAMADRGKGTLWAILGAGSILGGVVVTVITDYIRKLF